MERQTRQRDTIQAVIESYDRPLSPTELYEAAREHLPQLGIATVYRAIRDLEKSGWLRTVEVPGLPSPPPPATGRRRAGCAGSGSPPRGPAMSVPKSRTTTTSCAVDATHCGRWAVACAASSLSLPTASSPKGTK